MYVYVYFVGRYINTNLHNRQTLINLTGILYIPLDLLVVKESNQKHYCVKQESNFIAYHIILNIRW